MNPYLGQGLEDRRLHLSTRLATNEPGLVDVMLCAHEKVKAGGEPDTRITLHLLINVLAFKSAKRHHVIKFAEMRAPLLPWSKDLMNLQWQWPVAFTRQ